MSEWLSYFLAGIVLGVLIAVPIWEWVVEPFIVPPIAHLLRLGEWRIARWKHRDAGRR